METYESNKGAVTRIVNWKDGDSHLTSLPILGPDRRRPYLNYWGSWLMRSTTENTETSSTVTTADLFSGCGGLSVGVEEACAAMGVGHRVVLAADVNLTALAVFKDNFAPDRTHSEPIELLVDGRLGERLSPLEDELRTSLAGLDLAIGGPPCQGHSDLNNHTRRNDPKNALYLRMGRFVEVVRPHHVLIENVPGVLHDKGGVVACVREHLIELGYQVDDGVIAADSIGWPQRRRRHILMASLSATPSVEALKRQFLQPLVPLEWALWDLERKYQSDGPPLDSSARHSEVNQRRIAYLFDHDLYELPDEMRPDCHRLKKHTYRSVYGRLRPDEPAPTITSGFGSTGQGRFVHPFQRRTLTPHEAAQSPGVPRQLQF